MSKQTDIQNYIDTIIGQSISTKSLCDACKCTLPTVLTYIKNNPSRFEKVSRGTYRIKAATMTADVTSVTNATAVPTFDW